MMRTTVAVDHELMAEAVRLSGRKTKRGVAEQALKLLVQIKRQEAIRQLRGKLRWEGDLSAMRAD